MSGVESSNVEIQKEMDGIQQQLVTPLQSQSTGKKRKQPNIRCRKRRGNSAQNLLSSLLEKEQEQRDNQIPLLMENEMGNIEPINRDESTTDSIDDITNDNLEQILKKAASQKNSRKIQMAISFARIKLHEAKKIEARIRANKANINKGNIVKPTFSSIQVMHPLNFIENMQTYLEKIDPREQTVDAILDCLEGEAKSWAAVFKSRWTNKHDFIKDFFQQYWGRAEQSLLKKEIYSGRWNRQNETMSQHLLNLTSQAKWLPNHIPDDDLVYEIMQHYPKHVQIGWSNSGKSTMVEAMEFLRTYDEIEMLNRQKNAGFNPANNSKFAYKQGVNKNNLKAGERQRMWKKRQEQLNRNKQWVFPMNQLLSENVQVHVNAGSVHSDESEDKGMEEIGSNTMKPEDVKDTEAFQQKHQIIN